MVRKNIETKIRLNVILIYLLVTLVCGGIFFFFYMSSEKIDLKRKTTEEYNRELTQINDLIHLVNQAQSNVNLYIITANRRHLRQYQGQLNEINTQIDSIKTNRKDFGVDTVLSEITHLLELKEQSILLLNKQFTGNNPIDSLSRQLSVFSRSADTLITNPIGPLTQDNISNKGFWGDFISLFSLPQQNNSLNDSITFPAWIDTSVIAGSDTSAISRIIEQARENYNRHISTIEKQVNSVILVDQNITARITELLTMLYRQIIYARVEEINEDEALLHKSNTHAFLFGTIAILLILLFTILILRNVNKGYSARKALEQANDRAHRLIESRHKLLLSVSHDVKTPLNSILGYVDIYQKESILTTDEAAPIYHSGNHILSLLGNLLEFSGLEKGSITLTHGNFSPLQLCNELCEMFKPLAQKKALTFNYEPDFTPGLMLYSDQLKIKRILSNILSNAIKYTVDQGVTFKACYKENILEFQITDTGAGIPAARQHMLFKPFSRIEENSKLDEGSGVGLYVVKGLVDLFKGKIIFNSQEGKGTEVTIQLPVATGKKQTIDSTSKKILLIDDDEVFMNILSGYCRHLDHTVVTCGNQNEFNLQLENIRSFDYVLTDMEMGSFNGKDVLTSIRKKNTDIPVILITGREDYNQEIILSEGFSGYLPKPVTISQLHELIGGKRDEENWNNFNEFLGQDRYAVTEIMERFFIETVNHILLLKDAAEKQDIKKIQFLSHKMLPMFLQIKAPEDIIHTLKFLEKEQTKNLQDNDLQQTISILTDQIEQFLQNMQTRYLQD